MPFGKFRGVLLADLPDDYLTWLKGLDLREPLRTAVETEWSTRHTRLGATQIDPEVRPMAEELLTAGYRNLAQRHHPDHGGSTQTMTLVNLAAEALRKLLREAA